MNVEWDRKVKLITAIAGAVLGLVGVSLIVVYAGWQTAIGVFICLLANNLSNLSANGERT